MLCYTMPWRVELCSAMPDSMPCHIPHTAKALYLIKTVEDIAYLPKVVLRVAFCSQPVAAGLLGSSSAVPAAECRLHPHICTSLQGDSTSDHNHLVTSLCSTTMQSPSHKQKQPGTWQCMALHDA